MTGRSPDTVYDQLDRVQAQLAHLQATAQRILITLERIAGKPPPDGLTDAERNATRG